MTMINSSSSLHQNSDKRHRYSIGRNTKKDILISSTKEKLDNNNNNNHYQHEQTEIDCNNKMKQEILSSNYNENNTTLLTTTTTTTTVEVKVETTKTSSRKRKLNPTNDNNTKQQSVTKKKKNQRMTIIDDDLLNDNTKEINSKTVDQSSVTDESSFGSCEPGTSVVLQGIVWNETDKGVLVVNITWRGKTYVGALLNTTEQSWAPPRYKSDVRSLKQNSIRDNKIKSNVSSHESNERILRNGKRRASSTTVNSNSSNKTNSFKIPDKPPLKNDTINTEKLNISTTMNINDDDETNSPITDKILSRNSTVDDEIVDNYSSRSTSPTTSGTSTTSSSPPLTNSIETPSSSSIPIDLSNTTKLQNQESLVKYHFPNDILFCPTTTATTTTTTNSPDYFASSKNTFNISSFNKLPSSSPSSSTSHLPISSQLYFNSLTTPHYPPISSLSKSSN